VWVGIGGVTNAPVTPQTNCEKKRPFDELGAVQWVNGPVHGKKTTQERGPLGGEKQGTIKGGEFPTSFYPGKGGNRLK